MYLLHVFKINLAIFSFLQAALRMDKHTPKERRKERVEEVILEVGVAII